MPEHPEDTLDQRPLGEDSERTKNGKKLVEKEDTKKPTAEQHVAAIGKQQADKGRSKL